MYTYKVYPLSSVGAKVLLYFFNTKLLLKKTTFLLTNGVPVYTKLPVIFSPQSSHK